MKKHEPCRAIEELLRSEKPRVLTPPDLEAKILLALESGVPSKGRRFLPWLLLPAAAAVGVIMLRPTHPQIPQPGTQITPIYPEAVVAAEAAKPQPAIYFENPLARESLALQRDAGRAGHFLINCLPSFGGLKE